MPVDARPTIAAPDDDPYLWLEEIEGARALAWVEAAEQRHAGEVRQRRLCRGPRHAGGHSRPARQHSLRRASRTASLQFLEGRREPARPVAANDARQLPHRAAELGDHPRRRRAGGAGEGGLGVARRLDAAGHARSAPSSVCRAAAAMPPCCASSTSPPRPSCADGFYLPEAKGGADWLDRGHAAAVERLRPGHGDQVGLLADRPAVAARHRMSMQAPVLFETTPESMGLWASVDRTRGAETVWFVDKPGFFDAIFWIGDRSGPKTKLDLPTDIAHGDPSRLAGGEAPHGVDDRRQDLCARHAARHLAAGIPRR